MITPVYTEHAQLPEPKERAHLRANVGMQIKDAGAIARPVRVTLWTVPHTEEERENERASAGLPPLRTHLSCLCWGGNHAESQKCRNAIQVFLLKTNPKWWLSSSWKILYDVTNRTSCNWENYNVFKDFLKLSQINVFIPVIVIYYLIWFTSWRRVFLVLCFTYRNFCYSKVYSFN